MTRFFQILKPAFWSLMLLTLLAVACKKDDDTSGSDLIELLSFGPTGVKHGEEIRFYGRNLNKVDAVQFTGTNATVDKSAFTTQTKSEIKLIVPNAAERGRVTLKSAQGDIVSKAMFDLGVGATVTSMTEEARPGSTITINGTFLNWVTSVTFTKDLEVTEFVSQKFDELVVTVPENAETGFLIIAYSGTEAGDFETETEVKVTLPVATSVAPTAAKHGDNITLTGTNLDLVRKVHFNTGEAPVTTFVSQTATQLVLAVPGKTTRGKIKLEAASGQQTESAFELDIILPIATAIGPNGVKHNEDLTITGTNLDLTAKVVFSGTGAPSSTTFVSKTATQLVLKVPAGATSGVIKLEVASGVQTTSTATVNLTIPVISTMAPNPVEVGQTLTITGTNLDIATSVVFENSGSVDKVNFVSQSATEIKVVVPAGTANGKLRLGILNSTVLAESVGILEIAGAAPPPNISLHLYNDALVNWTPGWTGGWGGSADYNNPTPVRVGEKSVKISYTENGWGSPMQLGGGDLNFSAYSSFKISVYGAPGSKDKQVKIVFNNGGSGASAQASYQFGIPEEGKWTDLVIPFTSFTGWSSGITTLKELWVQSQSSAAFTIYVDEVGFY